MSSRCLQCRSNKSGGGCLTFCTCDADDVHVFCRISRKGIGQDSSSPVVDYSDWTSETNYMSEILKSFHNGESIGKIRALSRGQNFLTKECYLYNVDKVIV